MIERFRDVVVGPKLERLYNVERVVARGEHHDRHIGERADAAQDLVPVDVGQADVEEHDVGLIAFDDIEAGFA